MICLCIKRCIISVMQGVRILLSKLHNVSEYDIRLVTASPSYVKIEERVSLDPSSTIKHVTELKFHNRAWNLHK